MNKTLESLKKFGYSSMWVKTFSRGGNLFLDSILANKYIISRKEIKNEYYKLVNIYDNLYFYELINEPSYGYLLNKNDTIFDKENSFIISNSLYQNITENNNIFEIINTFDLNNVSITKNNEYTKYSIVDEDAYSYLEKEIEIKDKKTIYLEVLRSLNNQKNYKIFKKLNIYINDKLYTQKAFTENNNGVLNLGTYENQTINIKIELRKNIEVSNITLGIMDNKKYEEFISREKINTDIKYNRNQVKVNVNIDEEDKILFLPIAYNDGYKATNNGEKIEIIKLYDNFIGIKLDKGINNISITFIPKGLILFSIISLITLIFTIILFKT